MRGSGITRVSDPSPVSHLTMRATLSHKGKGEESASRALMHLQLRTTSQQSSLRTQGPITPGVESERRPLLQCRNGSPRRMGPCVRRDDNLDRFVATHTAVIARLDRATRYSEAFVIEP